MSSVNVLPVGLQCGVRVKKETKYIEGKPKEYISRINTRLAKYTDTTAGKLYRHNSGH